MSDTQRSRDVDRRFDPRRAIVTASDPGIGRATAVALAAEGMDVGITWHEDERGALDTAEEVRGHGVRAVVAHLDTTDIPACGDVVDRLADDLGGLDVLVNNAGTGGSTPLLELDFAEWERIVRTDLSGAFVCIQRAARRMVAGGTGGRIIAVSSVHEHQPRVGSSASGVERAAAKRQLPSTTPEARRRSSRPPCSRSLPAAPGRRGWARPRSRPFPGTTRSSRRPSWVSSRIRRRGISFR